ncbi:MerR family transcriptional regulator [Kribbella sindirgiensis]|uniref:MerR family transcriptional regulator n=1 Tax=Kribbella sindirgiensis TaxID=1124744 RepID=A0A4R0IBJ3_9ACTN|nr:MerR family transcriptional regulator [Kribbella sindirgiensis]TCC26181.1 MerR family transcriptional regulator [Kribbella sindirgiensis]
MRSGLTIGEFARATHLSVRTLRRYHENGLLEPAAVDPSSGYRYYSVEQIPSAQVIHRLRELDVPLAEVGKIIATDDPGRRAELVAVHLERLQETLERTRAAVTSLQRLLRPAPGDLEVQLRSEPARLVAGITDILSLDEVLPWYDGAMAELDAAVARPVGPPGGHYDDELFAEGRGTVLVYYPVSEAPSLGRVRPVELPAAELAATIHRGPHDDIDVTYGRLATWVHEHALAVAGPVQETYWIGPRDDSDPAAWRTGIAWPVFRVS